MILLFILIPCTIYFLSLYFFLNGLKFNNVSYKNSKTNVLPNISIIVCIRNGGNSVKNILNDLIKQTYEGDIEFLIVDDESEDSTSETILEFVHIDKRFKYLNSNFHNTALSHKKRALYAGIEHAKSEWLLFTDVDCRISKDWVTSMVKYYSYSDYVIGFSYVEENSSIVSRFQSIDFNMLMFSALSSVLQKYPLASTGQNQSYKKSLYTKVGGFKKIEHLLQGDDSIFLQLCNNNINVSFAEDCRAHVKAKTHNKWKDFLLQRVRWAGDANIMWKYNKKFFIIILSSFLANISLIVVSFLAIFYFEFLILLTLIILIKLFLEFSIYLRGCNRLNRKKHINSFFIWFLIQPIYILLMGVLSFYSNKINWKGRIVN